MPTGISTLAQFDCETDKIQSSPFTIIHRDNFRSTLPILHMNQMNNCEDPMNSMKKGKKFIYSHKEISKSNNHFVLASLQNNQVNPLRKKEYSKSHDNLINNDRKIEDSMIKSPMSLSTEDFTDILNAKLRKIQDQEDLEISKKTSRNKLQNNFKKPFITTVKSGEFLMPPPEVAALLGMAPNGAWIGNDTAEDRDGISRSRFRPLISLGRRPEVRHNSHNARCQAALKATVDFALVKVVNSGSQTSPSAPNEERIKRLCKNRLMTTAINDEMDHHPLPFGNIMFDRRVIRGSTFAVPMPSDGDNMQLKKKKLAMKRSQQQASRSMMLRIRSPPPVSGRKHEPVQTEMYLEELYEKPDEFEIGTQTDYFLDKPITPPYCPGKTGTDAETQITPGDLFDYDSEVQPILEILVGKTIEQALIEVLEEEELAALREQQRRFSELRAAEKAEQQRLEEQERRLRQENIKRVKEHEEAMKTQQETEERVAAAVLLTGYIAELLPAVLEGLKISGFLLDEIKDNIEEDFIPWLMKQVKKEMGTVIESRELLIDIITEILKNRAMIYKQLGEEYDSSRELTIARFDPEDEAEENNDYQTDIDSVNYHSVPEI